eukprot:1799291-Amphidinium_carterae.1
MAQSMSYPWTTLRTASSWDDSLEVDMTLTSGCSKPHLLDNRIYNNGVTTPLVPTGLVASKLNLTQGETDGHWCCWSQSEPVRLMTLKVTFISMTITPPDNSSCSVGTELLDREFVMTLFKDGRFLAFCQTGNTLMVVEEFGTKTLNPDQSSELTPDVVWLSLCVCPSDGQGFSAAVFTPAM